MKAFRVAAIILLLIVAINAIIAGYLFITDPSGSALKIPVSWLRYSPFHTFLVPGIILFTVNGLFNLIAAAAAIFRLKNYPALIVLQGILLSGWIAVQIIMLRDLNFLHVILGMIGMALFVLGNRLNL
jgi:hypothetical protein